MAELYKCKVPGCDFETDDKHAIAGHVAGHKRRGEMKGIKEEPASVPVQSSGKYKCPVPGCDYSTDDRHAIGGHIAAHKKKGLLGGIKEKEKATVKPTQEGELLKCPVPGCAKTSPTSRGMSVHIAAHRRRGELGGVEIEAPVSEKPPTPPRISTPYELAPEDVADALLGRVVTAINASDLKDQQIRIAQARITELEQENTKLKDENERILKIHNEQVRTRNLTTSGEIIKLAQVKKPKVNL